jgi:CheY-like chemotaxis protein
MNRRVPIVLLIEHDPIQSVTLARALKGGGYSVIPASRAPDALETFVTHHMDIAVVVADTQAATFGGLQLLSALGSIDPRVPVVAMSPAAAIAGGAAGYANVVATLTKPVAPADLIDHVQRVLQSPCSRDQQASPPILDTSLAPDYDLASAELSPALRDWVDSLGDCTSFRWPPTEEELDDIQVLDTQACPPTPPTQSDRHLRLATPPAPPACPPAQLVRPVHFVKPVEPVEVATSTQLVRRAPLAPLMRLAPPMQLVVRRFDGLRRTRRFTFKWTDRWVAVAATALIGLTLTTLLGSRRHDAARAGGTGQLPVRLSHPAGGCASA